MVNTKIEIFFLFIWCSGKFKIAALAHGFEGGNMKEGEVSTFILALIKIEAYFILKISFIHVFVKYFCYCIDRSYPEKKRN